MFNLNSKFNMKFCVKLGKTATETLQLLRDAYDDEALSRARVFEWGRVTQDQAGLRVPGTKTTWFASETWYGKTVLLQCAC
jgi:hypothetical protein